MWFAFFLSCLIPYLHHASSSSSVSPLSPTNLLDSIDEFQNYTAISDFRIVNRRKLGACLGRNPYRQVHVDSKAELSDDQMITVTVSGVLLPTKSDWIGMITPSNADVNACPQNVILYQQTGDFSEQPLLCHYPVKAQFVRNDPGYIGCKKKECKKYDQKGKCLVTTCSASITFHVINIRTDIQFVFFGGGFQAPCVLAISNLLKFANPKKPLYGHLSSVDSTGTSMRLTWVSGDKNPQQVQYANGKSQPSRVTTFSQDSMCTSALPSPAKDFGWHDPGYIHSVVMTGLKPSTRFSYRYGSNSAGWSARINFKTPPSGGSNELKFLAFGDMGKAPRDASIEHYIQPGSLAVTKAMADEISSGNVDSIFHIGDISYATGFLVEWDFFLHLITPLASQVSYMTAIGNHERDYLNSGSLYITPDSGGECGVAYESYFPMPTPAKDKPWYSIEQGSVHFVVISTEHDWSRNSEQYQWMSKDMASVDRSRTPWLIFTGHRPMYSSCGSVDLRFPIAVEPLLLANKVDLVLFGHVHNYERTCAVYRNDCKAMPKKGADGVDTYDNSNYQAPVHAIIGMAGFRLDGFPPKAGSWSLSRISEFGYARVHTTKTQLNFEVDLVLFGHVHNYERTCAVYRNDCKAMPKKGADGVDTYDNSNYQAPVHAIIGMAGFRLDGFPPKAGSWSLSRISEFGYARVHTTKTQLNFEVDLVLFGHVHNYERTCAVYRNDCKAMPKKGADGVDTYDNSNYQAPVHAIIGMAGFRLDGFPPKAGSWSLSRISEFGYARVHTTKTQLNFEFVNANTKKVEDRFRIIKS